MQPGGLERAAGDHDGQLAREVDKEAIRQPARQDDDPVHAPRPQRRDATPLLLRIPMPAGDHQRIAGRREHLLDATQQQRVVRALEVLGQQPDVESPSIGERPRDRVRHEAELLDRPADAAGLLGADLRAAAQHARDGTGRDAARGGHHAQRDLLRGREEGLLSLHGKALSRSGDPTPGGSACLRGQPREVEECSPMPGPLPQEAADGRGGSGQLRPADCYGRSKYLPTPPCRIA